MRRWQELAAMTPEERGEWMRSDTIDRHRDPEDGWWYMDQALSALRDADRRAGMEAVFGELVAIAGELEKDGNEHDGAGLRYAAGLIDLRLDVGPKYSDGSVEGYEKRVKIRSAKSIALDVADNIQGWSGPDLDGNHGWERTVKLIRKRDREIVEACRAEFNKWVDGGHLTHLNTALDKLLEEE